MGKKKKNSSRQGREYELLSGGWSGVGKKWPKHGTPHSKSDEPCSVSPFGKDWDPDKAFASTLPPSFDPKGPLVKRKGSSKKRRKRGTEKKNKNKPSRRKTRKSRKRRKK